MKTKNLSTQAAANVTGANRGNGDRKENLCSLRSLLLNGSKLFLCAAALALGLLVYTTAHGQIGGVPLWTNRYTGGARNAVAVDGSGNVIVAGGSYGQTGGIWTIKYSGAGVLLWTNSYMSPLEPYAGTSGVVVDNAGKVFVTGSVWGPFPPGPSPDNVTIAYSGGGVPLWTNRYDGGNKIALDGSGSVFVSGPSGVVKYSNGGVSLWTNVWASVYGGSGLLAVDGRGDVFVSGGGQLVKYSNAGVPLWTNTSFASLGICAVDGSGNLFVPYFSVNSTVPPHDYDYLTFKYSGTGAPLWVNSFSGPGNGDDWAVAVTVDGRGDVIVTGSSEQTASTDNLDYATVKYSGAGLPLWTNRYHGPVSGNSGTSSAGAIAVDHTGNVIVTGSLWNGSHEEFATIAYSSAGTALWTNRYNSPGDLYNGGRAVALDHNGNVFVMGFSGDGTGYEGLVIIKYSSAIPPSLTITRATTNTVAVSWPSPSLGFTLQQNTNGLATMNWSNVVTSPSDDGTTRTVILNPPSGNRYYRLLHP
jgi:hypothetical protein